MQLVSVSLVSGCLLHLLHENNSVPDEGKIFIVNKHAALLFVVLGHSEQCS